MTSRPPRRHRLLTATALAMAGFAASLAAHAENHALIMWIGDYSEPSARLPGIEYDGANARKIAIAMGVPAQNITEFSNRAVTAAKIGSALDDMTSRIRDGDKVFIYYSGHGTQGHVDGEGMPRCTEAMVTADMKVYLDVELEAALNKLGAKASQVVMFNDSCFSGGGATRSLENREDAVPKFLPAGVKANTAITTEYVCGQPANKMARGLDGVGKQPRGPQVLYVAAASDTETAGASSKGSFATNAWAQCLLGGRADSNGSGSIDGDELRACAQSAVNSYKGHQTITLQGNAKLPLTFVAGGGSGASPPPGSGSPVNGASTLEDLRAAADKSFQVQLTAARSSMRIRQDVLEFTVSSNRDGYLYVLQVGSDGKTFNLLFPNNIDGDNRVTAGATYRFPGEKWRVRAGGPAGSSYLLAMVSPSKKDVGKNMNLSSVFGSSPATATSARTLYVEATGAGSGGNGRYGASEVVRINEVE